MQTYVRAAGYASMSHGVRSATQTVGLARRERPRGQSPPARGCRCAATVPTMTMSYGRDPLAEAAISASPGVAGRRTPRSRASRRRSAACQRRRHAIETCPRASVGGRRLDDRDPRIARPAQRQQPVVVADQRDRASAQLGASAWCASHPTTSSAGWSKPSQPATQRSEPALAPRHRRCGIDQPAPLGLRQGLPPAARASSSAVPSSRSSPARTAVMTSTTCAAPWASARMSSASVIARPSKPARRAAGRSGPGRTGWPAGRRPGRAARSGRPSPAARPRRSPLGTAPARARPARRSSDGNERQPVVRVGGRVAVAREVLDASPRRPRPGGRGRRPRRARRPPRERRRSADAERRVVRVVGQVAHRRVVRR